MSTPEQDILTKTDQAIRAMNAMREASELNEKKYDALLKATEKKAEEMALEALQAKQDAELLKKSSEEMKARLDQMEAAAKRSGSGDEKKEELEKEQKNINESFRRYLKHGSDSISQADRDVVHNLEKKYLSVGSDPDGGYAVTPEVMGMVNVKIFETSPMRSVATVQTISTDALEFLVDTDEAASGGWVGEVDAPSDTNTAALKKQRIEAYEQYAQPKITQKMLEDSSINIESWLAQKISDILTRTENTSFISGTGVAKPQGILNYTSGTSYGQIEQIVSGDASALTFDGFIDTQNALKEGYQSNATWLMKRATFGKVMKLKNGNGDYLVAPGLDKNAGIAFNLLTRPVIFADDMPAVASNALSVAYGDFARGYMIVDRLGISITRDNLTSKPYTKYYTRKRVGGAVVTFEAIKLMKISA